MNEEEKKGEAETNTDNSVEVIINNEKLKECNHGCRQKAIFYCDKGCKEYKTYCLNCMGQHDHVPIFIFTAKKDKYKMWNSLFEKLEITKARVEELFRQSGASIAVIG